MALLASWRSLALEEASDKAAAGSAAKPNRAAAQSLSDGALGVVAVSRSRRSERQGRGGRSCPPTAELRDPRDGRSGALLRVDPQARAVIVRRLVQGPA